MKSLFEKNGFKVKCLAVGLASLLATVGNLAFANASAPEFQSITVTWNSVEGATAYRLEEQVPGSEEWLEKETQAASAGQTSEFDLPNPAIGETLIYNYRVIGCITDDQSNWLCTPDVATYSVPYPLELTGTSGSTPIEVEITYFYDSLGRLQKVADATNGDRNYQYDDAGNRQSVTKDAVQGGGN